METDPDLNRWFDRLDPSEQVALTKKMRQLIKPISARHLKHGVGFFVVDVGGSRITFRQDDATRTRRIYFAGTHKDYLTWCQEQAEK